MHELLNIDENQNYMLLSKLLFHISAKANRDQGTVDQEIILFSKRLDWLQSLKQFFINVSYHILVASLTLMALF